MDLVGLVKKFDVWQQKRTTTSFPIAVIKKYNDDRGGYLAALLTYYGFLSLFPLLLILITVLQIIFHGDKLLNSEVASSISHFFPLLGNQIQQQIHGMGNIGLGLVVGSVIIIYGTRGAAGAFRYALYNIWRVPKNKRVGFPTNILHDTALIAAAGSGFLATAAVSTFSVQLGHAVWVKVAANVLGFAILSVVLAYSFRIGTNGQISYRHMFGGAGLAAAVIQLLLTFGGLIMKHQLQRLDTLYGTFAVVLGLLFWIYILAQVILFVVEMSAVRRLRLYPSQIIK